jgi:aminoglycoside 3-N-acetyltransferase I
MDYEFKQLTVSDVGLLKDLLPVFGEAFEDLDTYQGAVPGDHYLRSLLAKPHFIAVIARRGNDVVGGLVAYELDKFERDRRELYIYDLAVAEAHRRKGVATGLIGALKNIARERRVYVIYVQADRDDTPAITLYESLGTKEDVHHFDIFVND